MQPLVDCYEVSFHNVSCNKETGEFYVTHDRIPEYQICLGKRNTLLVPETHLRAIDCYGGGIDNKKLLFQKAMWAGSVSEKMNGRDARRGFAYRTVEVVTPSHGGNK